MIAKFKDSTVHFTVKVTKLNKDTFGGTVIETNNNALYPIGYYGTIWSRNEFRFIGNFNEETSEINTPKHYDNSKGSLYKFANEQGLNSWEFDILKRTIRSRKKGNFKEDLEKTIAVIQLYIKEYEI
jgi:hypothetical protein